MNRNPAHSTCYLYAFDRVHVDGGYVCFGHSTHGDFQHVVHYDNLTGKFMGFVPPQDLPQTWRAATGFDGSVVTGDKDRRKPMPVRLMYLGVLYLFLALTVWYVRRTWGKLLKGTP